MSISLKYNYIPYKINEIIILIYLPYINCKLIRGIVLIYVITIISYILIEKQFITLASV